MSDTKRVNVRYPVELGKRLKEVSEATKISQNQLIIMATRELLRQYEGKGFSTTIKDN